MQEYFYLPPVLLHDVIFRVDPEAQLLHSLYESRRIRPARVGEEDLASGRQEVWYQSGQYRRVAGLVEHVSRDHEVETPEGIHVYRLVPVEEGDGEVPAGIQPRVVGGEVQGGLVVVGREDLRASCKSHHRRKTDAAAELDGADIREVSSREAAGQRDRARPELGPVREPLVALEVLLVDEGVGDGGVEDPVGLSARFDGGLGEGGSAPQTCAEFSERRIGQRTAAASRAARSSRL